MKKLWILAVAAAIPLMGCTTASLERHSLGQIHTTADYRCEAALNCLAAVAADPANLPPFSILSDGAAKVTDTGTLNTTTLWSRALGAFAMETITANASRSPQQNWTIDPVADFTQLQAMRAACRWVLYGPEQASPDAPGILNSPMTDPTPGPHFGAAERLAHMPPGWLHVGGMRDVPLRACYKGHCGATWVWVMPDGTEGLSEFILVLQDIATLDLNAAATTAPPLLVNLELHESLLNMPTPDSRGRVKPGPGPEALLSKPGSGDEDRATVKGKGREPADGIAKKGPTEGNVAGTAKPPSKGPDWSSQNSSQLVFSQMREIKPECRPWIEQKIQGALCGQAERITWADWMACTTPYYGQHVTLTASSNLAPVKPSRRTQP